MRIIKLVFFLFVMTVPTTINAESYLSQKELVELLALSGATPESAGMKQVRVCRITGQAKGSQPDYATKGIVASERIYRQLVQQARSYQVITPNWDWRVSCTAEWQLMSSGFVQLLGGEKLAKQVVLETAPVASTPKSEPVRFSVAGRRYLITDQATLAIWHDCQPVQLLNGQKVVKAGCN